MNTVACKRCGSAVEVLEGGPLNYGVLCEPCIKLTFAENQKVQDSIKRAQWLARWSMICPPLFLETKIDLLPHPDQTARALEWHRNGSGKGLNLWGFPDTGKTRTLFLVLQREHAEGAQIQVFTSGQFERQLEARAWKRAPWVEKLIQCDVLAFDDMDKMNLSREGEKVFFAILDGRMCNGRPVLLTHNSTAAILEYRFHFGEPMVRRIRDFCQSIHFPKL